MTGQSTTPLLDTVDIPADIRRLKQDQLRQLADELRQETIIGRLGDRRPSRRRPRRGRADGGAALRLRHAAGTA